MNNYNIVICSCYNIFMKTNIKRNVIVGGSAFTCAALISLGMLSGYQTIPASSQGHVYSQSNSSTGTELTSEVKKYATAELETKAQLSGMELKTILTNVGFSGDGLKTAWALAMRESNGKPTIVSEPNYNGTRDYGLFQLNDIQQKTYDFSEVLTASGNARIAYELSEHGTNFGSWGVGDQGWAGELYRTYPASWQQLNTTLDEWKSKYPSEQI